jgi:hypothetical protein
MKFINQKVQSIRIKTNTYKKKKKKVLKLVFKKSSNTLFLNLTPCTVH